MHVRCRCRIDRRQNKVVNLLFEIFLVRSFCPLGWFLLSLSYFFDDHVKLGLVMTVPQLMPHTTNRRVVLFACSRASAPFRFPLSRLACFLSAVPLFRLHHFWFVVCRFSLWPAQVAQAVSRQNESLPLRFGSLT